MSNVGIFVDTTNIYRGLFNQYGRKLDYKKMLEYFADLGPAKHLAAFGVQIEKDSQKFITVLKHLGFFTHFKLVKAPTPEKREIKDCKVEFVLEVLKHTADLDIIVLGTSDGAYVPLVTHLMGLGKKVVIFGTVISAKLKTAAFSYIEITESLLEG